MSQKKKKKKGHIINLLSTVQLHIRYLFIHLVTFFLQLQHLCVVSPKQTKEKSKLRPLLMVSSSVWKSDVSTTTKKKEIKCKQLFFADWFGKHKVIARVHVHSSKNHRNLQFNKWLSHKVERASCKLTKWPEHLNWISKPFSGRHDWLHAFHHPEVFQHDSDTGISPPPEINIILN